MCVCYTTDDTITNIKIEDVCINEFVFFFILKMVVVFIHETIQQLLKFLIYTSNTWLSIEVTQVHTPIIMSCKCPIVWSNILSFLEELNNTM